MTLYTDYPDLVDDHDLCDARNCNRLVYAVSDDQLTFYCRVHASRWTA